MVMPVDGSGSNETGTDGERNRIDSVIRNAEGGLRPGFRGLVNSFKDSMLGVSLGLSALKSSAIMGILSTAATTVAFSLNPVLGLVTGAAGTLFTASTGMGATARRTREG